MSSTRQNTLNKALRVLATSMQSVKATLIECDEDTHTVCT